MKNASNFNRFNSSFPWNYQETSILNRIEQNKFFKKIRDSLIEKRKLNNNIN